jgi:hypothetical protein
MLNKILLAALVIVPVLAFANPGAYVETQAGLNMVDSGNSNINTSTGFGGAVGVGYLWGTNEIGYGLEMDGTWYPNSTTDNQGVDFKTNGYNVSLLGVLKYTDCSNGFVGLAKLGAAYVNQKITATGLGMSTSAEDDQVAPEAALGVGYQFNPNWEMDLTANYVYTANNNVANNGNLLLGVTYHFV